MHRHTTYEDRHINILGRRFFYEKRTANGHVHRSWRSHRLEVNLDFRRWYHFSFKLWQFFGDHCSFCIALFGLSIYLKFNKKLKGDEAGYGIDINDIWMFHFEWGWRINGEKAHGVSWGCDWPWQYKRVWTKVLDDEGNVHHTDHDEGYYRRLFRRLFTTKLRKDYFDRSELQRSYKKLVSKTLPYRYIRKNGEVQDRLVTVSVSLVKSCWAKIPFISRVVRYMDYEFDNHVGEGVDDWKGGVVSSSIQMLPKETLEQCVRRMEATKKFDR